MSQTPPARTVQQTESELRAFLLGELSLKHAPAHLRLAFHDAGTYDVKTHSGGAHGAIHLVEEMSRPENDHWSRVCIDLLGKAKERFPQISWADLVAVSGSVAVEKCGGPVIRVGLGRFDAAEPAPEHRLPSTDDGADRLRQHFDAMGLSLQDLVALLGAHALGHHDGRPFTREPYRFSNAYYLALLGQDGSPQDLLASDAAMLDDPELVPYIESYAGDEQRFLRDFEAAYRRLTWLGDDVPDAASAGH
jgi:L-ascorbate peroxidase